MRVLPWSLISYRNLMETIWIHRNFTGTRWKHPETPYYPHIPPIFPLYCRYISLYSLYNPSIFPPVFPSYSPYIPSISKPCSWNIFNVSYTFHISPLYCPYIPLYSLYIIFHFLLLCCGIRMSLVFIGFSLGLLRFHWFSIVFICFGNHFIPNAVRTDKSASATCSWSAAHS